MPSDKPTILFDSSRLINRLRRSTLTGIDRVDIEYAKYLLKSDVLEAVFLGYGKKGHFIVPKPLLLYLLAHQNKRAVKENNSIGTGFVLRLLRALRWTSVIGWPRHPGKIGTGSSSPVVYINVSHGKLTKPQRFSWLDNNRISSLFFIHDLIPIQFPQYCTKKQEIRHRARIRTITKYARLIISISENTAEELKKYTISEQLPLPDIEVLPLAADGICHRDTVSPPVGLDGAYFVVLSTIEPRKNHLLLLQVWKKLIASLGDDAPKLVVVGRRGWENKQVFALLDDAQLQSHVIEFNGLSDTQVKGVLLGARALLSPSFTEGFGLPVVEALSLGIPVIASDIPSHREVGKGVPLFIEADDLDKWYSSILEYSNENSDARHEQMQRMKGFSVLSWPEHMKLFEDLLINKVLSS